MKFAWIPFDLDIENQRQNCHFREIEMKCRNDQFFACKSRVRGFDSVIPCQNHFGYINDKLRYNDDRISENGLRIDRNEISLREISSDIKKLTFVNAVIFGILFWHQFLFGMAVAK